MLALFLAAAPIVAPVVDCDFDAVRMEFAGSPKEQARCLLRHVERGGSAISLAVLPPALAGLVGQPVQIDPCRLTASLRKAHIALPATTPVAETSEHLRAIYFVIHDTSTPYIGNDAFPRNFGTTARYNDVSPYLGKDAVAHVFNDRFGRVIVGHDLEVGWRATKLEKTVGERVRGRFLHIENVQPRRADPAGAPGNDRIAPLPGFTKAQYETLALLYVVASARAGTWMIPGFHANIDRGIPKAHDDPQNFDLDAFDRGVGKWVAKLRRSSARQKQWSDPDPQRNEKHER